jgi:hypothetical protein
MVRYVKLILTSAVRKIATIKRLIYVRRVRARIMAHVNWATHGTAVRARPASTGPTARSTSTSAHRSRAHRARRASTTSLNFGAFARRASEASDVRSVSRFL